MTGVGPGGRRVRADIQALRGFAVLVVIAYHSGLGIAPAGYLGVDIFFVVSGFLISGIVMRQLADGRFRLRDFYLRRVRRLIPASHVVLLATTIAALPLLTRTGFELFRPQLIGSLGFATNAVLWRQINYFNSQAGSAPLLHMWSLAVEEQYYLLLPVCLMLVPRRAWPGAILAGTAISLVGYVWLYPRSPGLAFYLLPTRAWEIGLGSLVACAGEGTGRRWIRPIAPAALVALVALPFVAPPIAAYWLALPACVATAMLLQARLTEAGVPHVLLPIVRIGDMSYALYLVHWPLFAFAHIVWLGAPLPTIVALSLVVATFVLAVLLYHFVEEPIRRAPLGWRTAGPAVLASSLALAALATAGLAIARSRAPGIDLHGVTGLMLPGCDGDAVRFDGRCATTSSPTMLVWGDSFSQQILPALQASGARAIAQASKGQCAPLLGLAPVDGDASKAWAEGCLAFNRSVIGYLARAPSIGVVVLSGRYLRYWLPGTRALHDDGSVSLVDAAALVASQRRTTAAIRALGKRVIVMSGAPQAAFDVGQCWERTLTGLPVFGAAPRCAITSATAHPQYGRTLSLMDAFERDAATPVIRLDRWLCGGGVCRTIVGSVPLYRDDEHLGAPGSALIGRRIGLNDRILRDAH